MGKQKWHYYVLVATDNGPKFVTKINYGDKTAEWNYEDRPLEMDKARAEDLVIGLCLNFNMAYLVCQPFEIENHPYRYESFNLRFDEKEDTENGED